MVIKEYCSSEHSTRVVLREDNYGRSLAKFHKLFAQAQEDFPDRNLTEKDVEIFQYGGDTIKRTWGLEFTIPSDYQIPAGYIRLEELELAM